MTLLGCFLAAIAFGATANERYLSRGFSSDDTSSAEVYLRLADMRCEACTMIARDMIEAGAIRNTIAAVKNLEKGDANYEFRLSLAAVCDHCYRAAHYWEMNVLNRAAKTEEINSWLASNDAKPLLDYFQTHRFSGSQKYRHDSR